MNKQQKYKLIMKQLKYKTIAGVLLRLCGVISRLLKFTFISMVYIICLPYTGTLALIGFVFFILNEDFLTESKLDDFSDWFNNIAGYINGL